MTLPPHDPPDPLPPLTGCIDRANRPTLTNQRHSRPSNPPARDLKAVMRILHFCHNDPRLHPGGTEVFSKNLHDYYWQEKGHDSYYVAATFDYHRPRPPGTLFQTYDRESRCFLLWTTGPNMREMLQDDIYAMATQLPELLNHIAPQIIHLHHLLFFGADILAIIKRYCPDAKIVVSLHDFNNICVNDGVMTTPEGKLCDKALPQKCHKCVPSLEPAVIKRRELTLKAHLSLADQFLSPSAFLRQRFIDWGLPAEKIAVMRNGVPTDSIHPAESARPTVPPRPDSPARPHNRFGVFGNVSEMKGTLVALAAAQSLIDDGMDFRMEIHGDTFFRTPEFVKSFQKALKKVRPRVRHLGAYERREVGQRMAGVDWVVVPSVWWENAPLVIEEAFQNGRPVICSNIGGMAESVTDEKDGLHFPVGQASALAQTLRRALEEQGLWDRLNKGIGAVRSLADAAEDHLSLYQNLLTGKAPPAAMQARQKQAGKPVNGKTKPSTGGKRAPATAG